MKWLEEHPEEALALETKLRNELLANQKKYSRQTLRKNESSTGLEADY